MKRCRRLWQEVAVLSSAALTAIAVARENPYQTIIDRNAFGLKPLPLPPTNEVQVTPPVTVKLTGVTSMGGEPKAWFEITEPGPGKLPKRPPAMAKDQELDGVKVLNIDVDKGEVRIKNGTLEATLNFEKDGIKSGAPGAPAPKMAVVPPLTLPSVRPPAPLVAGATPNAGTPSRGVTVTGGGGTSGVSVTGGAASPYQNMSDELRKRYGLDGTAAAPVGGGVTVTGGGAGIPTTPSLTTIPTRTPRLAVPGVGNVNVSGPGTTIPAAPVKPQSYEESVVKMAVATEVMRPLIEAGVHPPFPPTELTPNPPKLPGALDVPPIVQPGAIGPGAPQQ